MTAADEGRDPLAEVQEWTRADHDARTDRLRPLADYLRVGHDVPEDERRYRDTWLHIALLAEEWCAARVADAVQQATDRALAPVVALADELRDPSPEVDRSFLRARSPHGAWLRGRWAAGSRLRAAVTPEARDAHDRRVKAEALREAADALEAVPDHAPSDYDRGRVDQRHMMAMELQERADAIEADTTPRADTRDDGGAQ